MTNKVKALIQFTEWLKTQPIYTGGGNDNREILIIRNGHFERAIEVYLEEKEDTIKTPSTHEFYCRD